LGLKEAHRDLKISPAEFDAVAGELARSLDHFNVPEREKQEVLAGFAGHKGARRRPRLSDASNGEAGRLDRVERATVSLMLVGRTAGRVAAIAFAACVAPCAGAASTTAAHNAIRSVGCVSERWHVKTLTDAAARNVSSFPRRTSVASLRRLVVPKPPGPTRIRGVETTAYRVEARLVKMKLEGDGDIVLVIVDPKTLGTMVVEFPPLACTRKASARHRIRIREARAALTAACGQSDPGSFTRVGGPATITGVGFVEPGDGVPDAAPNGIELHPVLGFRMTECSLGA